MTYSEAGSADKILLNGKILSVDAEFSIHQAIALNGDRILQVGSNQDIKSLATNSTQIFDLEGRTVMPGLNDVHFQFMDLFVGRCLGNGSDWSKIQV